MSGWKERQKEALTPAAVKQLLADQERELPLAQFRPADTGGTERDTVPSAERERQQQRRAQRQAERSENSRSLAASDVDAQIVAALRSFDDGILEVIAEVIVRMREEVKQEIGREVKALRAENAELRVLLREGVAKTSAKIGDVHFALSQRQTRAETEALAHAKSVAELKDKVFVHFGKIP
jgi:hypothetical protein